MKYLTKKTLCSFLNIKYSIMINARTEDYMHTNTVNTAKNGDKNGQLPELPDPPTNCCMSGCGNCVWVEYAEKLTSIFEGSEDKVREIVLSKVDDPMMKAYLTTELRNLKHKK